jgi:hypothetical protein
MTNNTDQKIGRDAIERYETLRKELDERNGQLKAILGPQFTDVGNANFPGDIGVRADDDDDE